MKQKSQKINTETQKDLTSSYGAYNKANSAMSKINTAFNINNFFDIMAKRNEGTRLGNFFEIIKSKKGKRIMAGGLLTVGILTSVILALTPIGAIGIPLIASIMSYTFAISLGFGASTLGIAKYIKNQDNDKENSEIANEKNIKIQEKSEEKSNSLNNEILGDDSNLNNPVKKIDPAKLKKDKLKTSIALGTGGILTVTAITMIGLTLFLFPLASGPIAAIVGVSSVVAGLGMQVITHNSAKLKKLYDMEHEVIEKHKETGKEVLEVLTHIIIGSVILGILISQGSTIFPIILAAGSLGMAIFTPVLKHAFKHIDQKINHESITKKEAIGKMLEEPGFKKFLEKKPEITLEMKEQNAEKEPVLKDSYKKFFKTKGLAIGLTLIFGLAAPIGGGIIAGIAPGIIAAIAAGTLLFVGATNIGVEGASFVGQSHLAKVKNYENETLLIEYLTTQLGENPKYKNLLVANNNGKSLDVTKLKEFTENEENFKDNSTDIQQISTRKRVRTNITPSDTPHSQTNMAQSHTH